MAKRNQLNVSVGVDTSAYKQGWDEVAKITVQSGQKTEQEAQKMVNALNKKFENLSIKQQIRQMETLAGKMEQMGLSGTKAFSDVLGKAGQLKATQSDLKDLIEASRPDAPFKAMGNALQGAAQAMAGVQGAMALFGADSEETQKALLKVQAALALVEGTKAIDQLSDSFAQLNVVMKANPAIFVAAAIVSIGAAVYELDGFLNHTVDTFKAYSDIQKKAFEATVKDRTELEYYKDRLNDVNISQEERSRLLNEVANKYPEYLGQINKEGQSLLDINKALDSYIALLDIKAKAQAAQELYVDALKRENQAKLDILKNDSKMKTMLGPDGWFALAQKLFAQQQQENSNIDAKYFKQLYEGYQKAADAASTYQKTAFGTDTKSSPKKDIPKIPEKKKDFWTVDNTSSQQQIKTNDQGLINFNNEFERLIRNQEKLPSVVKTSTISMTKLWMEMHKVYYESEQINSALNQFTADTLSNMAAAMGQAIANHENLAQAIGKSFLMSLADFLEQMGKMMVTTGTLWAGFQKMIVANPIAAAAIGVAAIAAGVALKTHVSNSGKKVEKFASGGMANSPTFALIGDNLNAHNNPEFVMRQDQLKKIYASGGGNNRELVMRMRGTDLYFFLEKVGRDIRR